MTSESGAVFLTTLYMKPILRRGGLIKSLLQLNRMQLPVSVEFMSNSPPPQKFSRRLQFSCSTISTKRNIQKERQVVGISKHRQLGIRMIGLAGSLRGGGILAGVRQHLVAGGGRLRVASGTWTGCCCGCRTVRSQRVAGCVKRMICEIATYDTIVYHGSAHQFRAVREKWSFVVIL